MHVVWFMSTWLQPHHTTRLRHLQLIRALYMCLLVYVQCGRNPCTRTRDACLCYVRVHMWGRGRRNVCTYICVSDRISMYPVATTIVNRNASEVCMNVFCCECIRSVALRRGALYSARIVRVLISWYPRDLRLCKFAFATAALRYSIANTDSFTLMLVSSHQRTWAHISTRQYVSEHIHTSENALVHIRT